MKDTKFIELLNLYVDQQIDPADAALLEQEISRNPARRETYREYCQMQRACGMLFEQSLPQAGVGEKLAAAAAAADRKVIEFPESASRGTGGLFAAGIGLAAACVAFAFVLLQNNEPKVPASNPVAVVPMANDAGIAQVPTPPASVAAEPRPSMRLIMRNEQLALNPTNVPESLKWLTQVDLAPLTPVNPNSLNFEMRPIQSSTQVIFTSPEPMDREAEKAAFQFRLGP